VSIRPAELSLALLAGVVHVLAFAPFAVFPLAFVTLAGLYLLVGRQPGWRAAGALGFAFGLGCFLAGVSWVYVSLSVFGGMAAWLAVLATLAFCATLALFPALALAAFRFLLGPGRRAPALAAAGFAACWTVSEWLRGTLFSGFPWLATGYSQAFASPLAGLAPLAGVYALSFATAFVAACLGDAWQRWRQGACPVTGHPRWAHAAVPLVFAGLLLAAGGLLRQHEWTVPSGAPLPVALLQGNIAQDLKWRPERFQESLQVYAALVAAHPARLTVLPETALPAYWEALPPAFVGEIEAIARARGGDLLLGVVTGSAERYTNSVVSIGTAPMQRYDKVHLVPFGEFVPPGFAWLMRHLSIPMSGFSPGGADQPPLAVGDARLAINICYEDVFGDELRAAARAATVLVNVSNTAWFGRSLAQAQHLQIAQLRARESGRPMLRATNTGMTAVIDPQGRVMAALPPFTRGALVAEVQGMTGDTPYLRFGDGPLLAGCIALLLALGARLRAPRRAAG
jgi:apolipoprotein N-acyltransferase